MHLCSNCKDSIDVIEKIDLHVSGGESSAQAMFCIVYKLNVKILLGTSFIEENILGILPQSKKAVPCSSVAVSIHAPKTTAADVTVGMALSNN